MVLTYDAYSETVEESMYKDKKILELKERVNAIRVTKGYCRSIKWSFQVLDILKQNWALFTEIIQVLLENILLKNR